MTLALGRTDATVDVWLTPPWLLRALGPFDLDPCASLDRPWPTADEHYTVNDDGLRLPWQGMVWLNPPYGNQTWHWLERLADHGTGIALIFARTETAGFFAQVWERADALLFLKGRIAFHLPNGGVNQTAAAPSVLIAYGTEARDRLITCGLDGALVTEWSREGAPPQLTEVSA